MLKPPNFQNARDFNHPPSCFFFARKLSRQTLAATACFSPASSLPADLRRSRAHPPAIPFRPQSVAKKSSRRQPLRCWVAADRRPPSNLRRARTPLRWLLFGVVSSAGSGLHPQPSTAHIQRCFLGFLPADDHRRWLISRYPSSWWVFPLPSSYSRLHRTDRTHLLAAFFL